MADYSTFKVLLDDPADNPGLSFDHYAAAFAEVIQHSRAQFSIVILGDWGTGKTTLMYAIKRKLEPLDTVVTTWFNAWRYEREPHLILPLLDTLRQALAPKSPGAASLIARAAKAFLAGISFSAGVPWLKAQVDPGKMIQELEQDAQPGNEPQSLYHAAFDMLRRAVNEFSDGGTRRVVIFVDDLDRCLPENALAMLESMKLFLDLEGVVFVAGLDQSVVNRAVALRYSNESSVDVQRIEGATYMKKIFQVPFALPRVRTQQLPEYLATIAQSADFPPDQLADFNDNVRRHLTFLPPSDSVNPRDVKRLINEYTLQLKTLNPLLREQLNPDVVLAIKTLGLRPDWAHVSEHLVSDPDLFQQVVREAAEEGRDTVWLSGVQTILPPSLMTYLDRDARALLHVTNLAMYVSVAEATGSTDSSLIEAQSLIGRFRAVLDDYTKGRVDPKEAAVNLSALLQRLHKVDIARRSQYGTALQRSVSDLEMVCRGITESTEEDHPRDTAEAGQILDLLESRLREIRRQSNLGPNSL